MRTPENGHAHDTDRDPTSGITAPPHNPRHPETGCARPAGRTPGHKHHQTEGPVAIAVRRGAAALQPEIPGEPPRLPDPGTGLRRAEAGDGRPARGIGEQIDGKNITLRRIRQEQRPITGTRLLREWRGVEHVVTVQRDGFEWQGRPYQSLSAIARAITGTRWNGWVFFGLRPRGEA